MKTFGIVSYNINGNFTNYGSALQSWALSETINKIDNGKFVAKLIDYCPDVLVDKDPLNPIKNMWDTDEETRKVCELNLPAIKINYEKFMDFYTNQFKRTKKKYHSFDFNDVVKDENIDGFVCGSDTIFCVDEFGIDDGFFANYKCMKEGYSVSYAASFGDTNFTDNIYNELKKKLSNFKAIGIREKGMVPFIEKHVNVPVKKVIDPTLLLEASEYDKITSHHSIKGKYLLLYGRRNNKKMYEYADLLAKKNNWQVIDISLRAVRYENHKPAYESGVEEFLSLVKNAEFIVTNSFHGMIFSVQFRKQFVIFTRELCSTKISELLGMLGLEDRLLHNGNEIYKESIDYDTVHSKIRKAREESLAFLIDELRNCK